MLQPIKMLIFICSVKSFGLTIENVQPVIYGKEKKAG